MINTETNHGVFACGESAESFEIESMEISLVPGGPVDDLKPVHRESWIQGHIFFLHALLASLSFAMHNYIVSYAMTRWHNSSSVVVAECFAYMAQFLAYHGYLRFKKQKTITFNPFGKSKNPSKVFKFSLLGRGVLVCITIANVSLISHYSKEAGVSPAVMLSLTIFSSFISACAFYYLY